MAEGAKGFTVVGIGELLWDLLPTGARIGGAPANYAYHCAVQGVESQVVSAVGDDQAGRDIVSSLEEYGLDAGHVSIDRDHPTGTVSVRIRTGGVPEYTIHENVAWDFLSPEPDHLELAGRADAVCFGSLAQRSPVSRKTIRSFLRATGPDCLRIYDINLRQAYYNDPLIRESLGIANILKLNHSELSILAALFKMEGGTLAIVDRIADRFGLRAIVLTRGAGGCLIRTDRETVEHEGFSQKQVADTVGAGDCFTAVFSVGLLRKESLEEIAEQANRLAAFVSYQEGAMPEMP